MALALCSVLFAQTIDLPTLYRQVDEAIDQWPQNVAQYEKGIAESKARLEEATTAETRYHYAFKLYEQYKAFLNDSALVYIEQCIDLANQMGDKNLSDRCRSLQAFQCSTVGLYNESLTILDDICIDQCDSLTRSAYYLACMHVYRELGYYTSLPKMRDHYYRLKETYRDSLYQVISHDSQDYMMQRILELKDEERWSDAMALSDKWLKQVAPDSRDYAIACYYRWLICDPATDESCYWLCQSALSDIGHAVMDQASLLALAERLNHEGDLDRSYKYIRFTWDCNNHFNTRMRSWQITPILNLIEKNYQSAVKHNTSVLTSSIVAVSILALLLMIAFFFVHRRNKQLTSARNALRTSNDELADANSQLAKQADELSTLNQELSTVNQQLSESNRVKEEYIGRFMSLCSQYIDKLDNYRKMVNKKMKNKELDELFRLSKSTELKEKELEELYEDFDTVFLHLFPNFIDDFNALLLPEAQVHPKEENRLTTEIRIFALIRLGFEDSSKIAEFLHYSVNTIYNYRARIKNGAVGNREQFEKQVKRL